MGKKWFSFSGWSQEVAGKEGGNGDSSSTYSESQTGAWRLQWPDEGSKEGRWIGGYRGRTSLCRVGYIMFFFFILGICGLILNYMTRYWWPLHTALKKVWCISGYRGRTLVCAIKWCIAVLIFILSVYGLLMYLTRDSQWRFWRSWGEFCAVVMY